MTKLDDATIKFWERIALGAFSLLTTIGLTIGAFTLTKTIDCQVKLAELQIRYEQMDSNVHTNNTKIALALEKVHETSGSLDVFKEKLNNIQDDVKEIKDLLKEQRK